MSPIKHAVHLFLAVLFMLSTLIGGARGETGVGYSGSEMNPQTHEFAPAIRVWKEGVVLDPNTGDYIVTYKQDGTFYEVVFYPETKIDPSLKSRFSETRNGANIFYRYWLKNGQASKQNISAMRSGISSIVNGSLESPSRWEGSAVTNYQSTGLPIRLNWHYRGASELDGLAPGRMQHGFFLKSRDLPGVNIMRIEGSARMTTWLGHVPEIDTPVGAQVNHLMENNFVPRAAAVPRIPNPAPFDAAVVLSGMSKHLRDDLLSMKLVDPSFATDLDRPLQAALDAVKINNLVGARESLKQFRKLLKEEHADVDREGNDDNDKDDESNSKSTRRIDKLAVRVLDFDASYVLKRLDGNEPRHEDDGRSENNRRGGR